MVGSLCFYYAGTEALEPLQATFHDDRLIELGAIANDAETEGLNNVVVPGVQLELVAFFLVRLGLVGGVLRTKAAETLIVSSLCLLLTPLVLTVFWAGHSDLLTPLLRGITPRGPPRTCTF